MLTLKISTAGPAFEGTDGQWELVRLLEVAAHKVKEGNSHGILLDINGNTAGKFRVAGVKLTP